jgi:YD repeat-containing protein
VLTGVKSQHQETGTGLPGWPLNLSYDSRRKLPSSDSYAVFGVLVTASPSLGELWSTSYHKRLVIQADASRTTQGIQASRGLGQWVSFTRSSAGQLMPDADISDTLTSVGAGYRYIDAANRLIETYDAAGVLSAVRRADGASLTYVYSDSSTDLDIAPDPGLLIRVTDNFGRSMRFAYERPTGALQARLKRITAADAQVLQTDYDTAGNFNTITWPGTDNPRKFLYERADLPWALTGLVDENQKRHATYGYDAEGRAVSTEISGANNRYSLEFQQPPQWTIVETLDDTKSFIWRDHYWVEPQSVKVTGPNEQVITVGSDIVQGSPVQTGRSQPAGSGCNASSSKLTYDKNANILGRTDFSDRKTCYAYDQLPNAQKNLENVRVEGLLGSATCPADLANYQVPGDLPLEQPQRKVTTRWHPAWRLPVQHAEPLRITSWVYNGQADPNNGNKPLFCAPDNAVLPDGQPIGVLCKRIEQATIDASGSKGLQAAPQGQPRQWSYTYNGFGQKLTEVDPRDKTSRWEYFDDTNADHTHGDLRSTTNAAGQTSRYSRYDKAGRLLTMSDANGVVSQYSYTPRGWLKSATVNPPAGGGASEVTGYDHYPTGLLKLATLPDGSTLKYDYDDAHRLTDITDSAGNTVHYTLDEMGNRKGEQLKDPSGTLARSITRIFDDLNRLQNVTGAPQ